MFFNGASELKIAKLELEVEKLKNLNSELQSEISIYKDQDSQCEFVVDFLV